MRRLLSSRRFRGAAVRHIGGGPIVLGNRDQVRDAASVKNVRSDFIGTFSEDRRQRAAAGDVLYFLDMCAGCAAANFITGHDGITRSITAWKPGVTLATVAFNSFMFRRPVYRGDLVVVTGSVVHAGRSSVGVHLDVARQGYESQALVRVGECYVTMVCVLAKELSAPVKDAIPGLRLATEEDKERYHAYNRLRALRAAPCAGGHGGGGARDVKPEHLDDVVNMYKPRKVSIADTVTSGVRMFRPVDLNLNNSIYGGEILRWMEEHALHCARIFAGSPHVHTIGMYDMVFDQPIYVSDTTSLEAKVVYVRHSTLEVSIEMRVERAGKLVTSNRAFFVLICMDGEGNKIIIPKGIDLQSCSAEHLLEYAKAKGRYEDGLKSKLEPSYPETPSATRRGPSRS